MLAPTAVLLALTLLASAVTSAKGASCRASNGTATSNSTATGEISPEGAGSSAPLANNGTDTSAGNTTISGMSNKQDVER